MSKLPVAPAIPRMTISGVDMLGCSVGPRLTWLIEEAHPSGRQRAQQFASPASGLDARSGHRMDQSAVAIFLARVQNGEPAAGEGAHEGERTNGEPLYPPAYHSSEPSDQVGE